MKKLFCASALLALGASNANAAWFTAQVDRMQIASTGELIIYFSSGVSNQCGTNRVKFPDTTLPAFKYIFAALLSYEAQKDPVQFLIESCDANNTGIFTRIEGNPGV